MNILIIIGLSLHGSFYVEICYRRTIDFYRINVLINYEYINIQQISVKLLWNLRQRFVIYQRDARGLYKLYQNNMVFKKTRSITDWTVLRLFCLPSRVLSDFDGRMGRLTGENRR